MHFVRDKKQVHMLSENSVVQRGPFLVPPRGQLLRRSCIPFVDLEFACLKLRNHCTNCIATPPCRASCTVSSPVSRVGISLNAGRYSTYRGCIVLSMGPARCHLGFFIRCIAVYGAGAVNKFTARVPYAATIRF